MLPLRKGIISLIFLLLVAAFFFSSKYTESKFVCELTPNTIHANKILIIGCSGSGKSTLALKLSEKLHLPTYHLDVLQWRPGWVPAPINEYVNEQKKIMRQNKWILEGNDVNYLSEQISYAEVVIFLDMPQWYCFKNICIRHWKYYKQDRPDMCKGCPSKFDWKMFCNLIWNFKKIKRPKILNILNEAHIKLETHVKIYRITTLQEINMLVSNVPPRDSKTAITFA